VSALLIGLLPLLIGVVILLTGVPALFKETEKKMSIKSPFVEVDIKYFSENNIFLFVIRLLKENGC
jgi:hypothetical protein